MQNIVREGNFEKRHFDKTSIRVNRNGIDVGTLVGIALDDLAIAALSGAPTGSEVDLYEMTQAMASKETDDVPPGLYFRVKNPAYIRSENRIGIYDPDALDGKLGLYVDLVDFLRPEDPGSKTQKGMAARMVGNMVRIASQFDRFSRIRLLAAGGRSWDDRPGMQGQRWAGFVAWPQCGFNMRLLPHTAQLLDAFPHFPKGLKYCRTVRDVLASKDGKELWRFVGDGSYMEFDLTPNSSAVQTLNQALGTSQYA